MKENENKAILSLDIGTKNFALISKSSLKFGVFAIGTNIKKRYDILSDFLTAFVLYLLICIAYSHLNFFTAVEFPLLI